jgi:hypothetical protein
MVTIVYNLDTPAVINRRRLAAQVCRGGLAAVLPARLPARGFIGGLHGAKEQQVEGTIRTRASNRPWSSTYASRVPRAGRGPRGCCSGAARRSERG